MKEQSISLAAIDDDAATLELIEAALAGLGLEITTYTDGEEGLRAILQNPPDIAVLDLILPRHDGMQLLEAIVEHSPTTEVLLMTGHYSTDSALEAIQKGACDYLTKPISIPDFRLRISRLAAEAMRRHDASKLESEVLSTHRFEGMVGQSALMRDLFARIRRIAPHFRTALITGATGTGKELVARALYKLSPASNGRFVDFNCSAVVETLFESELFGYVKGAFTGAQSDRMGLYEHASNGVLFLDELGDTPLSMQSKLLRALQNQEIRRVGSPVLHKVNVRVIAATNRDLPRMIAEGKFRDDLFYRLSMVELKVPRLTDRKEDVPLLIRHFLDYFNEQYNKSIRGFTPRAQAVLSRYSWPGNVREVENVLGAACMMSQESIIDIHDLRESLRSPQAPPLASEDGDNVIPLADMERQHARNTLKRMHGNKVKTAEALRISRGTLYRLLEEEDDEGEEQSSQAKTG
jgi:DNA-binding NtrC family response regulator